ncbi:MAG: serine protease [Betaproteobacteria bacterium]|nr:serine protease [Betaproteobacteria bacterium]
MNCKHKVAVCFLALATTAQANDFSIVNGSAADAKNYPWFVTVMAGDGQCGGSVVHPNWVLTAAHCFTANTQPSAVVVTAGRQRLSESGTGEERTAKRFIVHPDYNKSPNDNDVALIELNTPLTAAVVKLSPPANAVADGVSLRAVGRGGLAAPGGYLQRQYGLKISCSDDLAGCIGEASKAGVSDVDIATTMLRANGSTDPTQGVGYSLLIGNVLGMGLTASSVQEIVTVYKSKGLGILDIANSIVSAASGSDELREVDLPMANYDACQGVYGSLTGNMFCAGSPSAPKDTCQGDSGGPLVARNGQNTDWLQVGVVSFGVTCATSYGVYAKASNYLDWVSQYVPDYDADRVFMWGESEKVAGSLLGPKGDERSIEISTFHARVYPSGKALGFSIEGDRQLYYYDGAALSAPLGALSDWLSKAKAAGY